jgi:hypothetical protein
MKPNPVYTKLKAEAANSGRTPHLDTADAAACIRAALKRSFPKTKFSVKVRRYSGGSSINIDWVDGPIASLVEDIAERFQGQNFDGSIDLAYSSDIYLMPDGSADFAETGGTEGSLGQVPAARQFKPHPDAIRVSPSCYVFCTRSYSLDHMRRTLAAYAKKYRGCPLAEAISAGRVSVQENPTYGHWEFVGEPYHIRNAVGEGHAYGGDTVLRKAASRRMIAG